MLPLPLGCPSCGHGNPAGSNYCNACGMPVGFQWCPHCDSVNRSTAPHCYKCGVALGTPADAGSAAVAVGDDVPAAEEATPLAQAQVVSATRGASGGRRRVTLRVAMTTVLLVALAVPAYLTHQDFTPSPPLAEAPALAPASAPAEEPVLEPTAAAPALAPEPEGPDAAPPAPPAKSARQSGSKAKQGSGTRKSRNAKDAQTGGRATSQSAARAAVP